MLVSEEITQKYITHKETKSFGVKKFQQIAQTFVDERDKT